MRHSLKAAVYVALVAAILGGRAQAQGTQGPTAGIPKGLTGLVPEGYEIQSPRTFLTGTMGGVSFGAVQHIDGPRDVYTREFRFELTVMDKPQVLVASQGPIYAKKIEHDAQSSFDNRAEKAGVEDPVVGYDPPQLTKYPWGSGVTQRVIHKYMGAGQGPDEIEFSAVYFGLIVSGNVFKLFKLSVSGVDSREVADQWAIKAADAIATLTPADLSVK